MPEALERWPVQLMERLLPRHMQIIYEINAECWTSCGSGPGRRSVPQRLSLIEEGYGRLVRMGHLAFLGSAQVNGVSALHGELMKQTVFRPLHRLFPDRITADHQRRHARAAGCSTANPELATLISDTLGHGAGSPISSGCERPGAAGRGRRRSSARFAAIKRRNKERLATFVRAAHGHRARPRRAVRRADQAHPRIQAAAAEHPGGGGDLRRHAGRHRRWTSCRGSRSSPARRRPPTLGPS